LNDSTARIIEASDFFLRFLRQVRKLAEERRGLLATALAGAVSR